MCNKSFKTRTVLRNFVIVSRNSSPGISSAAKTDTKHNFPEKRNLIFSVNQEKKLIAKLFDWRALAKHNNLFYESV